MSAMTTAVERHWPRQAALSDIHVGVGAIVLDETKRILLVQRGPLARNEQGMWADPGGAVEQGETRSEAIAREVWEEVGIQIEQLTQLAVFDHRLSDGEHWVSVAFVAWHLSGTPHVREPGKCSAWGWFDLDALPSPLSPLLQAHLAAYHQHSLQVHVSSTKQQVLAPVCAQIHPLFV
jgi:8-oxo-dGTP diphosphatase